MRNTLIRTGLLVVLAAPVVAGEATFDAPRCFPAETALYLEVRPASFNTALAESPFGAILDHPRTREALGRLLPMAEAMAVGQLEAAAPDAVGELLRSLGDRIALGVVPPPTLGFPTVLLAVRFRGDAGEAVARIRSLLEGLAASGGRVSSDTRPDGVEVTTILAPQLLQPLTLARLGDSVVATWGMGLDGIIERHAGGAASAGLSGTGAWSDVTGGGPSDPLATALVHPKPLFDLLQRLETMASGFGGGEMAQIVGGIRQVADHTGIAAVRSASWQVALVRGEWEHRWRLVQPDGPRGYLEDVAETCGPPADLSALDRVPSGFRRVTVTSIAPGQLLARWLARTREITFPLPLGPWVDAAEGAIAEATGLRVDKDLATLPRIQLTSFEVPPPSGGLFPDQYVLCRVSEAGAYLFALDRFARHVGCAPRRLRIEGRSVAYLEVPGLLRSIGLGPTAGPLVQLPDEAKMSLAALDPTLRVAFTVLDDGWLLAADSPQAIERYFLAHGAAVGSRNARARVDEVLASAGGAKGACFAVLDRGLGNVAAWDTLVTIAAVAAPTLRPALAEYDMDLHALPPGAAFRERFGPGWVTTRREGGSFEIRARGLETQCVLPAARGLLETALRLKFFGTR